MRTFTAPISSRSRDTVRLGGHHAFRGQQLDQLGLAAHGVLLEQPGDAVLALGLGQLSASPPDPSRQPESATSLMAAASSTMALSISSSVTSSDGARRSADSVTGLTTRPADRAADATSLATGPSNSAATSKPERPGRCGLRGSERQRLHQIGAARPRPGRARPRPP